MTIPRIRDAATASIIGVCTAAFLCGPDAVSRASVLFPTYVVTDLGPVQSTGDAGKDINAAGTVAYTRSTAVYLWKNGGEVPTGRRLAGNGPLSLNNVEHFAAANNLRSYIYRNGMATDLGVLEASGSDNTFAEDLNDSDVVVGSSYRSSQLAYRAFIWQNGSMSQLPAPGGTYFLGAESRAFGINNSGQVAGSFNNQNPSGVAVIWTGGVATALATLAGYARSEAYGINASGQAVGYSADSGYANSQAVMWNGTAPMSLGSFSGYPHTTAYAINDLATVVGIAKTYRDDGGGNAFIWSAGQMADLNELISSAPAWHLTAAFAVNNNGGIVGYGYFNGNPYSFLLTPIPEPAAMLSALTMVIFAVARRTRKETEPRRSGRAVV